MRYIILGLLIGIIILFISIVILIILVSKKIQIQKKYKEEYIEQERQKWQSATANEQRQYESLRSQREAMERDNRQRADDLQELVHIREQVVQKTLDSLNEKKQAFEESAATYTESAKKVLDEQLHRHYDNEVTDYELNLAATLEELREAASVEYEALVSSLTQQLGALQCEVEDYRQKRDAINAEILRQRALDEQQDFYRICITDADLEDIDILLSLRQKLHKSSFLDKITYDTFVSKYVKEMAKRVLEGKDPSGIYKVTNIKTNEVYVGKSTTVATRWQNHTKSAFGLEGVADSQFQRALKKYGIQNFTWELLEEVPKDKLTEREKYYIDLYDTTKYGYNMRNG